MTEAERLASVRDYIAAESIKPFVWGETDCCSTADRWVQSMRGLSPLSLFDGWDGTRDKADECLSHQYALPVRVNRALRAASVARTDNPMAGDVGLAFFGHAVGIAIHAGDFWFSRGRNGIVGAPLGAVWKAWSI